MMESFELGQTPQKLGYEPTVVENPGDRYYPHGHKPIVMELPVGFDLEEARQRYEACGGRISYPAGEAWDHETVGFIEWLQHHGYKIHKPD